MDEQKRTTAIKFISDHTIGGYGVVWGDAQNTDLEGDYFTRETNFWLDTYTNQPALYDHALTLIPGGDDDPGAVRIGTVKTIRTDDIGLWVEAVIDDHNEWVQAVQELIGKGVLHWSSGSAPHMVRRAEDGRIKSWPIIEMSATPTPAEPRHTKVALLKHYTNGQTGEQPEAALDESDAAQIGASVDSTQTNEQPHMEVTTMGIQLSEPTAKAVIRAYAKAEHANIKSAVEDAVKQGGGNMIAESLRPLADQLAELAGVESDAALAVLVAYVAENVVEAEPEPEPEPTPEEMMSTNPENAPVLHVTQDQLDKAVQKALGGSGNTGGFKTKNVNVNLNREESKPLTLARWVKAVAHNRFDILEANHGKIKSAYKALGINPDTAGGYLVPVEQSNQIIELLRAEATVLPLCRTIPMNRDTMTIPTLESGATAYWVGENAQLTESEQTFGQKMLVAKKLGVWVKISNELLEDSDPSVDAIIREDIARVAALKIDQAILRGSGVGNEPLGILASGATTTALNAAPTYANLSDVVSRVEVENVLPNPIWQWVFHPREKSTLRQLEDSAGNLIFASGGAYQQAIAGSEPDTLLGYPIRTTTSVNNDGTETRAYFGQWQDVVVGQRKTLELMASNVAGSSFEYDQTWIRAILRMDVIVRHPESIEVLTDVQT